MKNAFLNVVFLNCCFDPTTDSFKIAFFFLSLQIKARTTCLLFVVRQIDGDTQALMSLFLNT